MYHHNNLKMWHEWCVNRTFRNFIEGFLTRLKCWFVSVSNKCLNSNSFFNIGFAFDTVQYVRETEGSSWQWRESWFTMQTVLGFIGLGLHIFKTSRNKDFFVDKDMSINGCCFDVHKAREISACQTERLWAIKEQEEKTKNFVITDVPKWNLPLPADIIHTDFWWAFESLPKCALHIFTHLLNKASPSRVYTTWLEIKQADRHVVKMAYGTIQSPDLNTA